MKSLLIAIGLTTILFGFVWLMSIGINKLAHWDSDLKFYIIGAIIFIFMTTGIYLELHKDKKIKKHNNETKTN